MSAVILEGKENFKIDLDKANGLLREYFDDREPVPQLSSWEEKIVFEDDAEYFETGEKEAIARIVALSVESGIGEVVFLDDEDFGEKAYVVAKEAAVELDSNGMPYMKDETLKNSALLFEKLRFERFADRYEKAESYMASYKEGGSVENATKTIRDLRVKIPLWSIDFSIEGAEAFVEVEMNLFIVEGRTEEFYAEVKYGEKNLETTSSLIGHYIVAEDYLQCNEAAIPIVVRRTLKETMAFESEAKIELEEAALSTRMKKVVKRSVKL